MRRNPNQIIIPLIVVLLLTGLGVGLYFLIEHIRKKHDDSKPKPVPKTKAVGADDTCAIACSSNPDFTGKTIVQQVNCEKPDGSDCDEKNCPEKPQLEKCQCDPNCGWKAGNWVPQ